jgi:hypothetical protein
MAALKRETDVIILELEDDFLIATYKKGIRIDLEVARQVVHDRLEFTGGRPVVALIENLGVISVTKEARAYFSSALGISGIKAVAILYNNPTAAILGNFIVRVNRPQIPVRLFSNRERAIGWLRTKA